MPTQDWCTACAPRPAMWPMSPKAAAMLHGEEAVVFADAGYQGADKRPDANPSVRWHVAMRPGKRKKRDKADNPIDTLIEKVEKLKASIRAKVEHPFRVVKRQFGYVKVRYRRT